MTSYIALGTTDDSTECGKCGKVELRRTVRIGVLDADGNVEETFYAGTTCAAKLTGRKAAAILAEALAADTRLADARRWRAEMAGVYGDGDIDAAAARYAVSQRHDPGPVRRGLARAGGGGCVSRSRRCGLVTWLAPGLTRPGWHAPSKFVRDTCARRDWRVTLSLTERRAEESVMDKFLELVELPTATSSRSAPSTARTGAGLRGAHRVRRRRAGGNRFARRGAAPDRRRAGPRTRHQPGEVEARQVRPPPGRACTGSPGGGPGKATRLLCPSVTRQSMPTRVT